jgi:predicted ATPase
MKIKSLELAKYRAFEYLQINLHPKVNVIAGVNGIGKSSILFALCVLIRKSLPQFTPAQFQEKPDFTSDDIGSGKSELIACIDFEHQKTVISLGTLTVIDDVKLYEQALKDLDAQRQVPFSRREKESLGASRQRQSELREIIRDYQASFRGDLKIRTKDQFDSGFIKSKKKPTYFCLLWVISTN